MYGLWCLPQAIPMAVFNPGWPNQDERPHPDCINIMLGSDQRAMWGRKCPRCSGYWRTAAPGLIAKAVCPYCGEHLEPHECLSDAHMAYVEACCALLRQVMNQDEDGSFSIGVKELIEQVHKDGDMPAPPEFFVEVTRQTRFTCDACGTRNDILGRFGYCSTCGTRNDFAMLLADIEAIRAGVNAGGNTVTALKEAVDAFDSFGRNYARQFMAHIMMTPARKTKWGRSNFAQIETVAKNLKDDFDIDILRRIDPAHVEQAKRMFHRRHLHAHRGGIVDQMYLDESGDTTVQLGHLLRETREDVIGVTQAIAKMGKNLHEGFHSIFPVHQRPIDIHAEQQAKSRNGRNGLV